ncbi:MAG: hypothetical protein GXY33_12425 [Phycisphaerae bacterium]|nr:hypothetical protein [Phycisphaerae bacterium]
MDFWLNLWTLTLIVGLGLFAVIAIVVAIGGAFDIRSLFRSLNAQHNRREP